MKIVYAGTPEFAVLPLETIINSGEFEVVGVITQEDKPQGRKGILTPPPVKLTAEKYSIPVLQSKKLREDIDAIKAFQADCMVTCAYGQILTQEILDCFEKGVYNIHAGLLPAYRGASPIQSCILNGETQTGVSVMKTDVGLDTGDIVCVETTDILENETCGELSARLSAIGANVIMQALKAVKSGNCTLTKQGEENARTVRKIHKEQAQIDFSKTVKEVVNLVRAMNPAPVAYTTLDGNKFNVYRAEKAELTAEETLAFETAKIGEVLSDKPKRGLLVKCADGAVKITSAQPAGGKIMTGNDLINGRKVKKGQIFYVE